MVTLPELQSNVFPGESGGDYNALFGYANRQGAPFAGFDLSNMTVDQALAFSDPSGPYASYVRGQIGRTATPMGAYQVTGSTLREAKRGLGLTGSEKMTPALQDHIAMWIYNNQGPGAWAGWGKGNAAGGASVAGTGNVQMADMGMPQQQPDLTFGEKIARDWKSGDLQDRLALAFNSLRMRPDQNLAAMVQQRMAQRREAQTANKTAQWLAQRGRPDLAQAMMAGALDARSAVALAMQQPEQVKGVPVGDKLVNPVTGQVMYDPTAGQAQPTLSNDQLTQINTLRDDLRSQTATFDIVKSGYDNVQAFYSNPGAVSDYALAVGFAKIVDPGSVAREGEVAAVQNAGAMFPALAQSLRNAFDGSGRLTPEARNEIAKLAGQIYTNKARDTQATIQRFQELATRAGLPPDMLWMGGPITMPNGITATASGSAGGTPPAVNLSPQAQTYLGRQ